MENDLALVVPSTIAHDLPLKFTYTSFMTIKTAWGAHKCTGHAHQIVEAVLSDFAGPFPDVRLRVERNSVSFVYVAIRFAVAILGFRHEKIPELIDAIFNNFRRNYGGTLKFFVPENATEYHSAKVQCTLHEHSCEHVQTFTYSPEENGFTKKHNWTVMGAGGTALHNAELNDRYWQIALQDAVLKYNLHTHEASGRITLQNWLAVDKKPKRLLVFGQPGIVHPHSVQNSKLDAEGQWTRYFHPVDCKRINHHGSRWGVLGC